MQARVQALILSYAPSCHLNSHVKWAPARPFVGCSVGPVRTSVEVPRKLTTSASASKRVTLAYQCYGMI